MICPLSLRLPQVGHRNPASVAAHTGFALDLASAVETAAPTAGELEVLRRIVDPEGVFLRGT